VVDKNAVHAAVLRETRVDKRLWDDQRLLDEPAPGDAAFAGDEPQLRGNRSLEHVFTILSLILPRAPLQIAFKGLLTSDAVLRGTSLEYLESVLAREIWVSLLPFLHDTRETEPRQRPSGEILDELLRSHESIELNLAELRKRVEDA
jgi:hypothetical protein